MALALQSLPPMLTVGGLLLGAVLTVPSAPNSAAPADPFDPSIPRVTIAPRDPQGDRALGLRDPFAVDSRLEPTGRRAPRPSEVHADLRDPFVASPSGTAKLEGAPRPAVGSPAADLRAPFGPADATLRSPSVSARPSATAPTELRDPFGR